MDISRFRVQRDQSQMKNRCFHALRVRLWVHSALVSVEFRANRMIKRSPEAFGKLALTAPSAKILGVDWPVVTTIKIASLKSCRVWQLAPPHLEHRP
jgi:hypothetical protein